MEKNINWIWLSHMNVEHNMIHAYPYCVLMSYTMSTFALERQRCVIGIWYTGAVFGFDLFFLNSWIVVWVISFLV